MYKHLKPWVGAAILAALLVIGGWIGSTFGYKNGQIHAQQNKFKYLVVDNKVLKVIGELPIQAKE